MAEKEGKNINTALKGVLGENDTLIGLVDGNVRQIETDVEGGLMTFDKGVSKSDINVEGGVTGFNPIGQVKEGDKRAVSGEEVYNFNYNNKNLFLDPFFKEIKNTTSSFSNLTSIRTTFDFFINDFNKEYMKSLSYIGSDNAFITFRFSLSDLGLIPGEGFSISALLKNTNDVRSRIHYFQLGENGNRITSVKYSNYITKALEEYSKASISDTLLIDCVSLDIVFEKYGGTGEFNFSGLSINKGLTPYLFDVPNTYSNLSNEDSNYGAKKENIKYPNKVYNACKPNEVTSIQRINAVVGTTKKFLLNDNQENFYLSKRNTQATASIILNNSNFWNFERMPMAVILPFYLDSDDHNITNIVLSIRNNKGANQWQRGIKHPSFNTGKLKKGWNFFRWDTTNATYTNFGKDISSYKIDVYSVDPVDVYFSGVYFEQSDKCKMLFINDHGRSGGWLHLVDGQTQNGIKDCEDIGMKITFALNPRKHEQNDSLRFTMEELEQLKESNIAYFSFHSYEAVATKTMDYISLQNDAKKSINWLQSKGFGKPSFRACFTQNLAENGLSNFNFMGLNAIATWKENTGRTVGFPFFERQNVRRFEIHNRTSQYIDEAFEIFKNFGGLTIPYTHAIIADDDTSSDAPFSCKLSTWNYFISKCQQGKNEGWLDFVSYSDLEKEMKDFGMLDNDTSVIERIFNLL